MIQQADRSNVDTPKQWSVAGAAAPWPQELIHADPEGDRTCAVAFLPVLLLDPAPVVELLLQVTVGEAIASLEHRWTCRYDDEDEARRAADWIRRHQRDAASACRIGTQAAWSDFDAWMRIHVFEEMQAALESERDERRRQNEAAERANRIGSFLVEEAGQFGLDLRRGDATTGFWRIMFRQRWERERFRDWFRCQGRRYLEFAAFLEAHGSEELERLVLREMLEAERQAKAAGLGAGGRRPLRFWRGG